MGRVAEVVARFTLPPSQRVRRGDFPEHPAEVRTRAFHGATYTVVWFGTIVATLLVATRGVPAPAWLRTSWGFLAAFYLMIALHFLIRRTYERAVIRLYADRMTCFRCAAPMGPSRSEGGSLLCHLCGASTPVLLSPKESGRLHSADPARPDKAIRLGPVVLWHGEPYREYEPLRPYPPDPGARYFMEAKQWSRAELTLAIVGAYFIGCFAAIGLSIMLFLVVRALIGADRAEWTLPAVLLLSALVGFGAGQGQYRVALLNAVRRRFDIHHCPRCKYPFAELRPKNGTIICPECGTDVPAPSSPPPLPPQTQVDHGPGEAPEA